MQNKIDHFDAALLELVQTDSRMGLESMANHVGLSVASTQRRLKALRDRNVITNEIAIVNPADVGYPMSFIVMVELERERLDQIEAFTRRAQAEPQVQQCYYVTGEADFCLICTAADMSDFEALTKRLFFEVSNVRRFRTSVVMSSKKVGLHVPVTAEP